MKAAHALPRPISIFIAGDAARAREICRRVCDTEGLCVTVTPTTYVYTGGEESGVIVGLIQYPRFPVDAERLDAIAWSLATRLREGLGQQSFTIQTPDDTYWESIADA